MPLLPPLITHLPNAQQLYLSAGGSTPSNPTVTSQQFISNGTGVTSGFIVSSANSKNFVAMAQGAVVRNAYQINNLANVPRWAMGVATAEGVNTGSDLTFDVYNDAGVLTSSPLTIERGAGNLVTINGTDGLTVPTGAITASGNITTTNGNVVTDGCSIVTSSSGGSFNTWGLIQPTNLSLAGLSINASLPMTVFSPPVIPASFNFEETNLNFNSLNYVTCTGATAGYIVENSGLIGYALGATVNVAASPTSTGILTVICLAGGVSTTIFSFDTAAIQNTVYTATRVGLNGLSTDWVRLIHT